MTTKSWVAGTSYYASAFDYAGGNGMQVAMDITWSTPSHSSSSVTATVKMYTDNQYTYNDNQTLNVSSNLGSSYGYNNTQGSSEVLRLTRTYTYTYSSGSYGSSPGTVNFTASVSGTYNGSAPSITVTGVTIPARPAAAPSAPGVSSTPGDGYISVSYSAPSSDGGVSISYYQKSADDSNWVVTGSNPFTVTGTNGTPITYYVRAVNTASLAGPSASTTSTPRTTPGAPTSFAGSNATFGQIALSWGAPSSNGGATVTGYVLRRGTTVLQDGTGTSYTETGLSPYTDYTYTVTAKNVAGEGTAAEITVKTIGGIAHIWNGSSYVTVLPKAWNGSAWVDAQARMWNGTEWKHGI